MRGKLACTLLFAGNPLVPSLRGSTGRLFVALTLRPLKYLSLISYFPSSRKPIYSFNDEFQRRFIQACRGLGRWDHVGQKGHFKGSLFPPRPWLHLLCLVLSTPHRFSQARSTCLKTGIKEIYDEKSTRS